MTELYLSRIERLDSKLNSYLHLARDEALATARLLCRKAPASTENWNLLGQLHIDRKDKSGALEAYRKSLSIQPNQPDTMTKVQKLQQSLDAREPGD